MTKVLIAPLSLFHQTDSLKTIKAFSNLGVSRWSILWNFKATFNLIDNYKIGQINTESFFAGLKQLYPVLKNKSAEELTKAWDSMVTFGPGFEKAMQELEKIRSLGAEIYFLSKTNPAHFELIQSKTKGLPGVPFLSYNEKALDPQLTHKLMHELQADNPINAQDCVYLTKPMGQGPYPNLWWPLRWLLAPIEMYFYNQSVQAVNNVQKNALNFGFKAVSWSPSLLNFGLYDLVKENLNLSELAQPASSPPAVKEVNSPKPKQDEGIESSRVTTQQLESEAEKEPKSDGEVVKAQKLESEVEQESKQDGTLNKETTVGEAMYPFGEDEDFDIWSDEGLFAPDAALKLSPSPQSSVEQLGEQQGETKHRGLKKI